MSRYHSCNEHSNPELRTGSFESSCPNVPGSISNGQSVRGRGCRGWEASMCTQHPASLHLLCRRTPPAEPSRPTAEVNQHEGGRYVQASPSDQTSIYAVSRMQHHPPAESSSATAEVNQHEGGARGSGGGARLNDMTTACDGRVGGRELEAGCGISLLAGLGLKSCLSCGRT